MLRRLRKETNADMKLRIIGSVLILCAVLMLAGCTVRKNVETPVVEDPDKINIEISDNISPEADEEPEEEAEDAVKTAFEEVLFRGGRFAGPEGDTSLSEVYGEGTEQEMAEANRSYAEVDLDGDGISEIILTLAMGDSEYPIGYELLHYDGEKIIGYYINYRGLMELKTDGSFRQSGGAMNWGVYSFTSFGTQEYTTEPLMRCESAMQDSGELLLRYFVGEAEVTESEFTEAVSRWESGNDAVFRHITEFGS